MVLVGCGVTSDSLPDIETTAEVKVKEILTAVPMPTPTPTIEPALLATSVVPVDNVKISLLQISDATNEVSAYARDDWRHWIDVDGDCQNARHEVLFEESVIPVTFTDTRGCSVSGGQWVGLYTGVTVTTASKLDVDHMVPLANAHRSGGWAWDSERKKQYANTLSYAGHLIAVTASANRSKGAKGPEEWRPPDSSYWCNYATDWMNIKATWGLTATTTEWEALTEMLDTCSEGVSGESHGNLISTIPIVELTPTPTAVKVAPKTPTVVVEATCVDLNTAPKEELQRIVHIGASRAEGIIAIRPIKSITDLGDVSGIGPSRLNAIVAQNLACI
jgi:DNA uptake protein ComE-like DNA-binding protein